ncbi:MAG: hypothetical protein JNL93_13760 [Pelomonas sp.]|nr:hypothetical protein [Roseateles sp.]
MESHATRFQPRPKHWYERFRVVCLTIALSAVVLFAAHHYLSLHFKEYPGPYLALFCKELAFAAVVALFLNLSIEWVNRRRHDDQQAGMLKAIDDAFNARQESLLEEIHKKYKETADALLVDVFATVYKKNFEPRIFKVVEKHILNQNLIREDYRVGIRIDNLPPDVHSQFPNMVKLTFTISFRLRNTTNKLIKHAPVVPAYIDVTPGLEAHCKFISARIDRRNYQGALLDQHITVPEGAPALQLMLAEELEPAGIREVLLRYEKVAPQDYSEVVCCTTQMDGMDISVLCLEPALAVHAVSLHPESEEARVSNKGPEICEWRINHGILPGQGVVVFWYPARDRAQASVATK